MQQQFSKREVKVETFMLTTQVELKQLSQLIRFLLIECNELATMVIIAYAFCKQKQQKLSGSRFSNV